MVTLLSTCVLLCLDKMSRQHKTVVIDFVCTNVYENSKLINFSMNNLNSFCVMCLIEGPSLEEYTV